MSVRRIALVVLLVALVAAGVGSTYAAFTASTANPASSFTAAATFPPVWVRHVGSDSCGGASSSVTVPAGGIPAGQTLLVQVVVRGTNYATAVAVSDSRGNTYAVSRDVTRAGDQLRTVILSGYVVTALQAGDSIDASHGNAAAEGMAVDEVRRLPSTGVVVASNGTNGSSNQPSVAVAPTSGDRLIYGGIALAGTQTVNTEAANFQTAHDITHSCGGPNNRARNHAGYRIVASGTSFTYNPQLSGSVAWVAGAAAYSG